MQFSPEATFLEAADATGGSSSRQIALRYLYAVASRSEGKLLTRSSRATIMQYYNHFELNQTTTVLVVHCGLNCNNSRGVARTGPRGGGCSSQM